MEEKRTHVTVDVCDVKLGLFIESDEPLQSCGAVLRRFETVDGAAGEVERHGGVRVGFRLERINDVSVAFAPFHDIVSTLVSGGRPMRLTWRDPDVAEWRDSFGFLRTKLHADKAAQYLAATAAAKHTNDLAWLAFLGELGGKRGVSFGVQRLLRDAAGLVVFPEDPAPRINAVSPTHGRMRGIGSSDYAGGAEGGVAAAGAAAKGAKDGAGAGAASEARGGAGASAAVASVSSSEAPAALQVISIHSRCWVPSSIGVSCPPGLQAALPDLEDTLS